jgi:adenine/guanine phosphoribosyltransferase-like PRPP-binding protein
MLHYNLKAGLSDLPSVVRQTVDVLAPHAGEFDSIAVQGTSGLVIGAPVALAMHKPLVIVREEEDMRCVHSVDVENGDNAGQRVLFLDDQVSTGRTRREVQRKIASHTRGTVTAQYLYQDNEYKSLRPDVLPRQRGWGW